MYRQKRTAKSAYACSQLALLTTPVDLGSAPCTFVGATVGVGVRAEDYDLVTGNFGQKPDLVLEGVSVKAAYSAAVVEAVSVGIGCPRRLRATAIGIGT